MHLAFLAPLIQLLKITWPDPVIFSRGVPTLFKMKSGDAWVPTKNQVPCLYQI